MLATRLTHGYPGSRNVPTGVISVGAIQTITDDTKYNAWIVSCRMPNGKPLIGYTKGDTHHADTTGKAVGKIAATDEAAIAGTWGTEFTIYSNGSLWATVMGLVTLSTGRIVATLWRDDPVSSGSGEAGIVYSDNNGATWSAWKALTNGFTQEAYGAGPAIELGPGGAILVTIEGSNSGQAIANRSSHTVKSSDGGDTWGSEVTVRNYVTDTRPYYESKLVAINNQRLLCVHRTSGGTGTHYISTSTDSGTTWGAPVSQFAGYGAPSTIILGTGTLIVGTRKNSNGGVVAFSSVDNGVTWSSGTDVDVTMFEMEYACPLQLRDGRVLLVYGSQPSSGTTNCDIKSALLSVA